MGSSENFSPFRSINANTSFLSRARIPVFYDDWKVTELGTRALEEVWISRRCLCFFILGRSINKRETNTKQQTHKRTYNQQKSVSCLLKILLSGSTPKTFLMQRPGVSGGDSRMCFCGKHPISWVCMVAS